jgi:hypothetical protein
MIGRPKKGPSLEQGVKQFTVLPSLRALALAKTAPWAALSPSPGLLRAPDPEWDGRHDDLA